MSTTYVKFTGLATGAVILGNGSDGWTPVNSNSFDQTLATDLANGQASQTAPNIMLPLADSGVAVEVQAAAAAGQMLKIEVASYDSSGRLTSDDLLTRSEVKSDQVTAGTGSSVQELTVQVNAYTSQTTSCDPGTGTPTTTDGGYGFIAQKPITTPLGAAPADPSTLTASAGLDSHAYNSTTNYVAFTGSNGNLIASQSQETFSGGTLPASGGDLTNGYAGHVFEVDNPTYGLDDSGSATTASLSYEDRADVSSPVLFQMLLTGHQRGHRRSVSSPEAPI